MAMKLALLASVSTLGLVSSADWDYSTTGAQGPARWAEIKSDYLECAGRRQSPINIDTVSVITEAPEFLRLSSPAKAPTPLTVKNTGYTVSVDVKPRDMTVVASTLEVMHKPDHFHFHTPSEHTVDGKAFDAEVHMVTANLNNHLLGERPHFTVLGMFFESVVGAPEDPLLKKVLSAADQIASGGDSTEVTMSIDYDLPSEFYEYDGSLTTPPCWETVRFMLGTTPRGAPPAQLALLESLMPQNEVGQGMNARPVQAINSRVVTKRKFIQSDVSQVYSGCASNPDAGSTVLSFQGILNPDFTHAASSSGAH